MQYKDINGVCAGMPEGLNTRWNRFYSAMRFGRLAQSERVNMILAAGIEVLRLDAAFICDLTGDQPRMIYPTDHQLAIKPMCATTSAFVLQSPQVVALHDVCQYDVTSTIPVEYFLSSGIYSYVGVPIMIQDELFGVLNFVGNDSRRAFSQTDILFVKTMGQQISNLLASQQAVRVTM